MIVIPRISFRTEKKLAATSYNFINIFKKVMDTERLYLDYNATTPLDPEVRKAIKVSVDEDWANPSSGK